MMRAIAAIADQDYWKTLEACGGFSLGVRSAAEGLSN